MQRERVVCRPAGELSGLSPVSSSSESALSQGVVSCERYVCSVVGRCDGNLGGCIMLALIQLAQVKQQ